MKHSASMTNSGFYWLADRGFEARCELSLEL
jgi:hypothetical protein